MKIRVDKKEESKVLATAAANQTWAAQLLQLKSAFDGLTSALKRDSYLLYGESAIFPCTMSGVKGFSGVLPGSTGSSEIFNFRLLDVPICTQINISTSGAITVTNLAQVVNQYTLELVLR